jgi:hypothetical protein
MLITRAVFSSNKVQGGPPEFAQNNVPKLSVEGSLPFVSSKIF